MYRYLIMFLAALTYLATAFHLVTPSMSQPSPTVLVEYDTSGHGTGVHIGRGRIVTARHVADSPLLRVLGPDGVHIPIVAVHKFENDVAVIQIADWSSIPGTASLMCHKPSVPGDPVFHEGYPQAKIMQHYYGRTASRAYRVESVRTKSLTDSVPEGQVFDMFWSLGSSGGGIFHADSYRMVGMVIGMYGVKFPIKIAVPVAVVCNHVKTLDASGF